MAYPSDSLLVQVKKELLSEPNAAVNEVVPNMETPLQQPMEDIHMEKQVSEITENSEAVDTEEDDIHYISGDKPFYDVILAKSHVKPSYIFQVPAKIARELPHATVPVVLRCGCKNWNLDYVWHYRCPRFDITKWKKFVTDNSLEEGDACVFELMECSNGIIKFNVIVLKNNLPPELLEAVDCRGSSNDPILVE